MFLAGTGARTAACCSVLFQAFLLLLLLSPSCSSSSSSPTLSSLSAFSWGGVLRSRHGASLRRYLASLRVLMCWTLGSDCYRTCLLRSGASYDNPGFRFCRGLCCSGDTFRCAPVGLISGIVLQGIEVKS